MPFSKLLRCDSRFASDILAKEGQGSFIDLPDCDSSQPSLVAKITLCMPQILACLRKSESILFALYRLDLQMVDRKSQKDIQG